MARNDHAASLILHLLEVEITQKRSEERCEGNVELRIACYTMKTSII